MGSDQSFIVCRRVCELFGSSIVELSPIMIALLHLRHHLCTLVKCSYCPRNEINYTAPDIPDGVLDKPPGLFGDQADQVGRPTSSFEYSR